MYSLPELDGAIDTVVLGGLVGDKIGLIPERVRKMNERIKGWVGVRSTPAPERKVAIIVYGFPPNVGAVSSAGGAGVWVWFHGWCPMELPIAQSTIPVMMTIQPTKFLHQPIRRTQSNDR